MRKRRLKRSVVVTALGVISGLLLSYIASKVGIKELLLILIILIISMIVTVMITYEDYEKKLKKSYQNGCMNERKKHPTTISILMASHDDEILIASNEDE